MALGSDGKLVYILEVDDKGSPVIKKFSGNIDKVGKSSSKAAQSTRKLNSSLGSMKSIIAGMGVGLLAKQLLDAGAAFESSISDLSAITGATGKDLEFMKKKALEFSNETTVAAKDTVEAFKLVASAKPELLDNANALSEVTREAIRLSEASGITLANSANAVGASLNQFGEGANKAAEFVNVLAAGAKFGASEIDQTTQALKVAGTVAHSTGLSFQETNAAIQLMANVALKGAEAGTGLRSVLLKLENQTNEKFKPSVVGFSEALKNLRDANLTATEKTKLFGLESITAANALIDQADSTQILTDKLTGTNTATEQARTKTNNLNGDLARLKNQLQNLGLTAEGTANVGIRAIVQGFSQIITKGGDVKDQSQQLSLAIAGFADVAGNAVRGIALPFEVLGKIMATQLAALSLVAEGEFSAALDAIKIGGNDVIKVFDDITNPAIANRFTNLAKKMISDMSDTSDAADKAKKSVSDIPAETKPVVTVDDSTVEPTIYEINAQINKLSKEATIKAIIDSGGIVPGVNDVNRSLAQVKGSVTTTASLDASALPGEVAAILASLDSIPREITTVHRLVSQGGASPVSQGSRATGGLIPHDGYYMMHAGERVVSNSQSFGDINISVPGSGQDVASINWREIVRTQIIPELAAAQR